MDTTELQEARVLLHRILRAMNALPNRHIPNEEAFPNTYAIAEQVSEHLRHWHPAARVILPKRNNPTTPGGPNTMIPCPFHAPNSPSAKPCGQPLQFVGLIPGAFQPRGNELFRWDCPHGHTILGEFTAAMGDDEQQDEDDETNDETDDAGHPIDESPSYRDSMNDAGRGHLLREGIDASWPANTYSPPCHWCGGKSMPCYCGRLGEQRQVPEPAAPMHTQINAQPAPWGKGVRALWNEHAAPLFKDGDWCGSANFFTPRPYVDEYNRGSDKAGFTYVVHPGHRVCFVEFAAAVVIPGLVEASSESLADHTP